MKKRFAFVISLLLAGALAVAQTAAPTPAKKALKPQTATAAEKVQLNPQPLPPGAQKSKTAQKSPGSKVELNPQLLPPGAKANQNTSAASKVELNPQPLPPGAKTASGANTNKTMKSKKGSAGTNTGGQVPK